jgi:hypothetical protein
MAQPDNTDQVLALLIEASKQTALAYQFNPGSYAFAAFMACKNAVALYETRIIRRS